MNDDAVIASVRQWVESFVVGLNLCPFAKRELLQGSIRFVTTRASTEEELLVVLRYELELLGREPSMETTLLIHPAALPRFQHYNQFLGYADELLVQLEMEGIYQIASFHPEYQFEGTDPDDAENYTNRSPYPILHLLREESLERGIDEFEDVGQIPARNIELMNRLGVEKLKAMLQATVDGSPPA